MAEEELRGSKSEKYWYAIAGLKMEKGAYEKECIWLLVAESSPWLTSSKLMGTSVLQLQGTEFKWIHF